MKLDLGFTPEYLTYSDEGPVNTTEKKSKKKEKPVVYPSIHLEGDAAKTIGCHLEIGGEFTALVTFRCVAKREQAERNETYGGKTKEGRHVELELRNISSNKIKESDEKDDGDSSDKAVDEFFSK